MVHVGSGGTQTRVDVDHSPGVNVAITVDTTTFSSDVGAALAVVAAALAQPGALDSDQRARAAGALSLAQEQVADPTNSRLATALTTLHELAIGAAGSALWDAAKLVLAVVLAQFRN
jgi:hypothetical protein